jgi:hypothetical protein
MLINIPAAVDLNETALRLYFDAWDQALTIITNFKSIFESAPQPWDSSSPYLEEWCDYLDQAQSELGAIAATAQQSAEIRLKSIICETSPYLLLLRNDLKLKPSGGDIDFADQRTLDAADLPAAVRTLTQFELSDAYVESYSELRRLRNKVMHTGLHQSQLEPQKLIQTLTEQYSSLWPDGKWLFRRVKFDGNSATSFFVDGRWSSTHTNVMEELSSTIALFDNALFKKCIGTSKSSLKGHCPVCKNQTASKIGNETVPTAARLKDDNAECYMCENELKLVTDTITCDCESTVWATALSDCDPCCFKCGEYKKHATD